MIRANSGRVRAYDGTLRAKAGTVGAAAQLAGANPGHRTFRCRFLLDRQPQNPVPDFLQAYVLLMFYLDSNQWSTTRDDLSQLSDRDSGRLPGDDRDLLSASPRPGFHLVRARDRSAEDGPAAAKGISSCNLPGRASKRILPGRLVYGGDSRG